MQTIIFVMTFLGTYTCGIKPHCMHKDVDGVSSILTRISVFGRIYRATLSKLGLCRLMIEFNVNGYLLNLKGPDSKHHLSIPP